VYEAIEAACFTSDFELGSWNHSIIPEIDVLIVSDVLPASVKSSPICTCAQKM
jgi:hypothetical protein